MTRRLFLIISLIALVKPSFSQIRLSRIDTVTTTYCRVKLGSDGLISPTTKIFALVDFGFKSVSKGKIPDPYLIVVDDEDKKIYVSGYTEILNTFYQKGWELVEAKLLGDGNVDLILKKKSNPK